MPTQLLKTVTKLPGHISDEINRLKSDKYDARLEAILSQYKLLDLDEVEKQKMQKLVNNLSIAIQQLETAASQIDFCTEALHNAVKAAAAAK